MNKQKVAVLGGGIQGICVALALAKDPRYIIHLIDKNKSLLQETSLINEGKIHLGFVYALDDTFQTAERMLHDGLSFAPTLEYLVGHKIDWGRISSSRFEYLVSQHSMVGKDLLLEYYHKINDCYQTLKDDDLLHYLGNRLDSLLPPLEVAGLDNFGEIKAGVVTEEKSVNTIKLRRILLEAVSASTSIHTETDCLISHIRRDVSGFRLTGEKSHAAWQENFDIVVNCLWTGRLQLDQQMGMLPDFKWIYRKKYRLLAMLPTELQWLKSYTIVQGQFGDLVNYETSQETYLSWYPSCMKGLSHEVTPPKSWSEEADQEQIIRESLTSLNRIFPGIEMARVLNLSSGVIFARGKTDISDVESELHTRFEQRV
ncbi:MAG: FAD-dependent oxidoreductase, partial [Saprospiraceae bacterium]|nr:FAD-dependent oxidoreductase [Saprospiraceae bacterium]